MSAPCTFLSPAIHLCPQHSVDLWASHPCLLSSLKSTMLPPISRLCSCHSFCLGFSCLLSLPRDLQLPAPPTPESKLSHHILTEACLSPPLSNPTSSFGISCQQTMFPCFLRRSHLISFPHVCVTNVWLCHCVTIQAPLK